MKATLGLTPEQQAIRRQRLGASDMAAVMGLDDWRRPAEVWLDKKGLLEDDPSEAADWGLRHEPAIRDKYLSERDGIKLAFPGTLIHPEVDVVCATPDAIVVAGETWTRDLQIKAPSEYQVSKWGEPGTDDIPERYIVQVQIEMAVTSLPVADVAVLLGGNKYRVYIVFRDEELIGNLLEYAQRWWRDFVVADVQPPVEADGDEATDRTLKRLFPRSLGRMLPATAEARVHAQQMAAAQAARKRYERDEEACKQALKAMIGDADGIDGLCSWKSPAISDRVDYKSALQALAARMKIDPRVVAEVVAAHTTAAPPQRRFLLKLKDGD